MTFRVMCTVSLAAMAFAMPVQAQDMVEGPEVRWNLSTWGAERGFTAGIEKAAELVSERTDGNFTIEIHYGEALSASQENLDGLQLGAFQAAMMCNFYHPGKNPAWMVLSLPFLPLGDWEVSKRVREAIWQHPLLKADMERWNAMPYLSALNPQYEFMGVGEPPEELSDWEGRRVRAGGGIGEAMEVLGATRSTVPATEVYTSMERGTIDAASFPYTYSHAAFQIDTVSEWYTTNMSPGTSGCGTLVAIDAFEELPEQYQELLLGVKDEAYDAQVEAYQRIDEENLPRFEENLTQVTYTDEQLAEFQEIAGQPVWDAWVEENQDDFDAQGLLDFVFAEIEKVREEQGAN